MNIQPKIVKRASKLLDRIAKDVGPEAESAKRRLANLMTKHPWLEPIVEGVDGGEIESIDLAPGSRAHRLVAMELCDLHGCDLCVTLDAIGMIVVRVTAPVCILRGFLRSWYSYEATLDATIELLGMGMVGPLLNGDGEIDDDDEGLEDEDDHDDDHPCIAAFHRQEAARCQSNLSTLASVDLDTLKKALMGLVDIIDPERKERVRALITDNQSWDDPKMSLVDFLAAYRSAFPRGRLDEVDLEWNYYRAGKRIDPLTHRWRYCAPCHRDKGNVYTGE
jgi:hypothetical protein